jgi:hypothetical protein
MEMIPDKNKDPVNTSGDPRPRVSVRQIGSSELVLTPGGFQMSLSCPAYLSFA